MKFINTTTFLIFFLLTSSYSSAPCHFSISVLEDPADTLKLEQVRSILNANNRIFISADSLHKPFSTNGTYWLYIRPLKPDSIQDYVLAFHLFLSRVEVYSFPYLHPDDVGGLTIPYRLKKFSGSNLLLKAGAKGYLVRVQNRVWASGSVKNTEIVPIDEFYKKKQSRDLLQAFIQGFLWLMLFYNLLLFFTVRKSIHIYYVIYVFLNSLFFFFLFGYSEIYLFPASYRINLFLWTFQLIASIFYLLFLRMALNNHCTTYTPAVDRWIFVPYICLRVILSLSAASTVFFRTDLFTTASAVSNVIGTLAAVGIIIFLYKGSDWFMRALILGSVILIIFGWAGMFYVRFVQQSNNLFFETGMVIELLIFTYALNKQYFEEVYKAKLVKRQLEDELDAKNRELVYQAMQLSAKDEAIASINEKIKELENAGRLDAGMITETVLNSSMQKSLWKEFEVHFSETHPGFYRSLLDNFPDLTHNEIRLCAFLKLNLNTKEIAMITQKSAKSIEVMRSRIRQKMGIQRDTNLNHTLAQFE